MAYLLDTHVLIWWLAQEEKYAKKLQKIIGNTTEPVYVSAASVWEISLKKSKGKLKTPDDLAYQIAKHHFVPLSISLEHALLVEKLPWHHTDPFDRLLISQAITNALTLITHDKVLKLYAAKVRLI